MPPALRIAFRTVGCRLNQAETVDLAAACRDAGYHRVPWGGPADVCVVHSCTITANAERDSLRLARQARRACPAALVVLAGCAVEVSEAERIKERAHADLVLDQQEKWRLPEHIGKELTRSERCGREQAKAPATAAAGRRNPGTSVASCAVLPRTRALLGIQDGCTFGCAYCIVPRARPAPWSRPLDDIVARARDLAQRGYRELVLTGANLGCYRTADATLVDVLTALDAVEGLDRVRLSSIELTTAERDIVDVMRTSATLCRSLHIPLQSGSDRILAAMGRRYTAGQYRAAIAYACNAMPRLGLGTDIIVGFPGETDADFAHTRDLVASLPFSNLHVFSFSPRPGTPAAALPDKVPTDVTKQRAAELIALGQARRRAFAEQFIGRQVEVLVETVTDGVSHGLTREYLEARLAHPGLVPNQVVRFTPASAREGILAD